MVEEFFYPVCGIEKKVRLTSKNSLRNCMIGSIKKIFAKDLIAFIDILAFVQFLTNSIPKYQTQRRSMNLVEHLIYILCGFQPLTIFTKNSISDV